MFVTLRSTAQSAIIYEVLDRAGGPVAVEGGSVPEASLREEAREIFAAVLRAGDVFAVNDPYCVGATHPSDIMLVGQSAVRTSGPPLLWKRLTGRRAGDGRR